MQLDQKRSKKATKKKKLATKKSEHQTASSASPVKIVEIGGVEVHLLGTAHVSRASVDDVKLSFEKLNPQSVCVELCQSRYDAIKDPDRWQKLDIGKVIREKKLGLLASNLILSAFQKKIGESTGVAPGEEMMVASELAEKSECNLILADRDVRTTLSRAWGMVGFFSKMWLVSNLLASLLVKEDLEADEIERMKNEDVLSDLFSALPERYNTIKHVIIDERDQYLSEMIARAARDLANTGGRKKKRILAVLGAGHLPGVERLLLNGEKQDLESLLEIPPKKHLMTILYWGIFSAAFGFLGYYLTRSGAQAVHDSLIAWIVGRSLGSAIGAILARAHLLTILVTTVMAPVSVFIPGSRLWMFSALTEVWLKKPRVDDFENIARDTSDFKGFMRSLYYNRILKLFWIITLVSFGLTVGNIIFWAVAIYAI